MNRLLVAIIILLQPVQLVAAWNEDTKSKWLTYSSPRYKFTIKYPRQYVKLRERRVRQTETSELLKTVRFQDRRLAFGDTANLEPPQLTIEIFNNPQGIPLRDWLRAKGWLSPDDSINETRFEGAEESLSVEQRSLLAPNEFYYFRTEKYVFKLTPLGQTAQEMINTFQIIG